MKVLILPIDNRPVTCVFPRLLAELAGLEALLPPRRMLGGLTDPANPGALASFVEASVRADQPDALLLCLDSLIYGGLVSSRRSEDPLKTLLDRTACLDRWRRQLGPARAIFGQSSIMRISDNYDATEEKPYWARFGREIFAWSGLLDRLARGEKLAPGTLAAAEMRIPPDIRQDYLQTRWRNHQVNRHLLEHAAKGNLDFLAFSLDDSGASGLNRLERDRLAGKAADLGLEDKVFAYPGADEVLMALLARLLARVAGVRPAASVLFSPQQAADCQSLYEGQTVGQTVASQLLACGITGDGVPDFIVIVHGKPGIQGDHVLLPGHKDTRNLDTSRSVASTLALLESANKPVVLCDVAYANGADPALVAALVDRRELVEKLWGYAGWNTTGNAVGSALAMGVSRWFALKQGAAASGQAVKRCLFVRFCDDWAYQAMVRKSLTRQVDAATLAALMSPHVATIAGALGFRPDKVAFRQPWQRTFEIEVDI